MDIDRSNIVKSLAGRDRGRLFFVLDLEPGTVLLADGKVRRVERPKSKKVKHIEFIASGDGRVAEKIRNGAKVTNSELRRTLADYTQTEGV